MNVKLIFTIFFSDFIDLFGIDKFSELLFSLSNSMIEHSIDVDLNGFGIFIDGERE
jgi:hypothetical protein